MGESWGITSAEYSWIVTSYYIGYILFHWVCIHPFELQATQLLIRQHSSSFSGSLSLSVYGLP